MMTKFMNKQRGLLAAIMALVMVFAGAAFVAAEVDATDNNVAEVNGTGYEDFYTALSNATAGQTVKLLKDVELSTFKYIDNINIDGNGKILDLNTELYIDGVATIENLTIKTGPGEGMRLWIANNTVGAADISFNKVNILNEGNWSSAYVQTGNDYKFTFTDCNFGNSELEVVVIDDSYSNQIVSINNCTNLNLGLWVNPHSSNGGDVTIGSEVVLQGTEINTLYLHGQTEMIVPNGQSVKVNEIKNGWESDSAGTNGTVAVENGGSLSAETSEVTIGGDGEVITSDINAILNGTITTTGTKVIDGAKIDNITNTITVGTDVGDIKELIIKNSTLSGTGSIVVKDGGILTLDSSDVRLVVDEKDGAIISVTGAKTMEVKGYSTDDLGVGYGNTLILSGFTVPSDKSIEAYGTVIIEGDVAVEGENGFKVYKGGNAQIDGTLTIQGTATIDGDMEINGSVKVYNYEGGAFFNVGGTGVVDILGTMEILKPKAKDETNTLDIAMGGNLNVEGTLTISGTLEGTVNDMGTIVFNGIASADGATIKVFDGITLNVAAVSGTLIVTDAGIIDTEDMDKLNYAISASDVVTLTDVKGVTVSVVIDETVKKVKETVDTTPGTEVKYRFYTATMTVSGNVVDNDVNNASVKIENDAFAIADNVFNSTTTGNVSITWPKSVSQSSIIIEDITVGKNVAVEFAGMNIDVEGTVTAVAENASITVTVAENVGVAVDLMGSIIIGDDAYYNPTGTGDSKKSGSILAVNGAHYTVQSADMTEYTEYYVTLAAALAATDAYENQIDIIGKITVDEALEIAADKEVLMDKASELTIDVDGTVTVAAGALLDASDAKITVKGMLVIADKESGLDANNGKDMFIYQVVTETGDSITYSGLVLALQNAVSGDTITITGQTAEISESVTIPEGVTLVVPAQSKLTVGSETEDVTLTINGVLDVQRSGILANETASYKETIVINGVLKDGADTANLITTFGMEDFVAFEMKIDGRLIDAYSNLAFASENFSGETITIYGDVSAGDITFDAGDDALTIQFAYITQMVNSTSTVIESSLSIGTMTLVGENVTICTVVDSTNQSFGPGTITGTVASAAGSMDLNKVTGITIKTAVDEDVEGTTDLLYVNGTLDGKMTVATGTVTMDAGLTIGTDKDDILTIASGAVLATGNNELKVVKAYTPTGVSQYTALTIEGTLSIVKGKLTVEAKNGDNTKNGKVVINDTLSITDSTYSTINGEMVVLGQLAINDTEEKAASLTVAGKLEIGAVPALGANASVSGPIAINGNNASVIVYEGANVSTAIIDPKADDTTGAKYTDIKVNGTEFMTVYVDKDNASAVTLQSTLPDIEGYDVAKADWTANGSKITGTTVTVGTYEMAEATLPASKIGLTVSAGVGLKVYIDGLSVDAYYTTYGDNAQKAYWISLGTHTVSIGVESGYDGTNATITVNGVQVSNNGTFTLDVDDKEVVIIASGAVPAQSGSTVVVDDADDGMALTDILLIVLVVLIVIMAIIVALRMMRS